MNDNRVSIISPEKLNVSVNSSDGLRRIAGEAGDCDYILLDISGADYEFSGDGLRRFVRVADDSEASMLYSDYCEIIAGERRHVATTDYLLGSVRNDFDFGPIVLLRAADFAKAASGDTCYRWAGFYDLRLRLSRSGQLLRIPEPLYTVDRDVRSGMPASQFDYVDPRNRAVQLEMEQAFTAHLKAIGAYVAADRLTGVDIEAGEFPVEASVVIPVRNRAATVADAVCSALSQEAPFDFNVIVVDNHSDDGTSEILDEIASGDARLIIIRPESHDLGIGGCWMAAVDDARCGRFAVQLDSDDLYDGPDALARIVAEFRRGCCAMVVGAYRLTDFDRNTIPPGLIDHAEWTADNGHNNLLRVNGIGAPRAFFTPVLRATGIPNVSYGEDYAVGLAISRRYRIGRIYDSLYCCRRWDGNSDAHPSPETVNRRNFYKDRLRTIEIQARQWK